jgi:FAD/FMN-containing dehydrogenase
MARGRTVAPAALVEALAGCGVQLVTDPAVLAGHCVDWTGRWSGPALGMVRPRSTDEVARVLAAARRTGVPVQVQGGNTGLVGGSVPADPALLLVTTGLDRIGPVDVLERSVVAGAGVTAATVAAHAQASGLGFGVDLAARDSATIGGMAATNAGGIGVSAYGMMREQVRGITAVLPDGRTIRTTGRPRKDNAGYDLTGLLVGSEGTLAVITEVELALHPRPPRSTVALLAVGDLAGAVRAARAVQVTTRLLAAEVVDSAGVARASRALGLPDPLAGRLPWLLLLEVADSGTGEGLAPVAGDVVAMAVEPGDRARLWAYRERQTELYAALPEATEKLDVSVRLDRLDRTVTAIRELAAAAGGPAGAVGVFGHALDGNLHVQLVGTDPDLAAAALHRVASLGGAISAEHGIGRLKAGMLDRARSPEEIAWMREIKDRLDPGGLLNPGVLLER